MSWRVCGPATVGPTSTTGSRSRSSTPWWSPRRTFGLFGLVERRGRIEDATGSYSFPLTDGVTEFPDGALVSFADVIQGEDDFVRLLDSLFAVYNMDIASKVDALEERIRAVRATNDVLTRECERVSLDTEYTQSEIGRLSDADSECRRQGARLATLQSEAGALKVEAIGIFARWGRGVRHEIALQ